MAPAAEVTAITAWVGDTAGLHPEIVPSSLAKRKRAGPEVVPLVTTKLVPPLNTVPVGAPGTFTTRDCGVPLPLYRVETAVSLSATHQGLVPLRAMPQAFTRWGSV